jgi:hypothetical protein
MEIWRILNGFTVFKVNLGDFNYFINIYHYFMGKRMNSNNFLEMYVFLQVFYGKLKDFKQFNGF